MGKSQYPRVDCVYGWCPRRCAHCTVCDEIKRLDIEKRAAHALNQAMIDQALKD